MRIYRPTVVLRDQTEGASLGMNLFAKCLRFSTHCNYVLHGRRPFLDLDRYKYLHWDLGLGIHGDLEISFDDGVFGKPLLAPSKTYWASQTLETAHKVGPLRSLLSDPKAMTGRRLESTFGRSANQIFIDVHVDVRGQHHFIGAVASSASESGTMQLVGPEDFPVTVGAIRRTDMATPNSIVTWEFERSSSGELCGLSQRVNSPSDHWDLYRALGINIPLLYVQGLLGRAAKPCQMVSTQDLDFGRWPKALQYNFDADEVCIDLDETLIWEGEPIPDIVHFLRSLAMKDFSIHLVTRHAHDVKKTLEKVGIPHSFFSRVSVVGPEEQKSRYVVGNAIFIDNEFVQRWDVRKQCGVPVLDLDQIDFLSTRFSP